MRSLSAGARRRGEEEHNGHRRDIVSCMDTLGAGVRRYRDATWWIERKKEVTALGHPKEAHEEAHKGEVAGKVFMFNRGR